MDRDSDREAADVRALLTVAAGDGLPATDLLAGVRRRVRRQRIRRRVLLPSLATLATASVLAVAVLAASVVTGAPSAQARVAAAAGRTANESYRVQIVSTKSAGPGGPTASETSVGVFDPARRTGRLLVGNPPVELRFVDDMVYLELPERSRSGARRWVAERRASDSGSRVPLFVQLTKLTWQDPQQALVRLRSAAAVRDQGRAAGDGWSGRRYAFELTGDQGAKAAATVTGSVEVDQAGRVRRLEVQERLTAGPAAAGTVHTVMEFRDYGVRETVSAPPASAIDHDPPSKLPSKARSEKAAHP